MDKGHLDMTVSAKPVVYCKITNAEENHGGFQYHDGLNVLKEKFNDHPGYMCREKDLHFTTVKYIHKFYSRGIYLRIVTLPECNPNFKMVKDPSENKWRANMLIFGKRYSLDDLQTYKELGIKHLPGVNQASGMGLVNILNWLVKNNGQDLKYSSSPVDWASRNGQINVLDWWLDQHCRGLKLKYTAQAIDCASINGRIPALNWWLDAHKKYKLELKYTRHSVNCASINGQIDILNWWLDAHKKYGLRLKYTRRAIHGASMNGRIDVLNWWLHQARNECGLKLKYMPDVIKDSCNRKDVMNDWWSVACKEYGLNLGDE